MTRVPYALDPTGCPAGLSWPQAPHLAVQCERRPGHDGDHEAWLMVRTSIGREPAFLEDRKSVRVYCTWWTAP